jgi:hypothetical protein
MDLKALDVCYNSIELFLSLVSIFNFNLDLQYSSPNCHSKSCHVGKHHRVRLKIFFEPFECFGRVYWVHKVPEPVERYLIWISNYRFDGHIGGPKSKCEMGPAGIYGHQINVLRSK